jgi:hypothetical protein
LSAADPLGIVREILKNPGGMFVVRHAEKRKKQRPARQTRFKRSEASDLDIRRVLERGAITEGPYIAAKSGWWRMNITGRVAGEEMTFPVEIEWCERVIVITILN